LFEFSEVRRARKTPQRLIQQAFLGFPVFPFFPVSGRLGLA
jgi:hypothetical protein